MSGIRPLCVVVGGCLLIGVCWSVWRRPSTFQDRVPDPVFTQWVWQGYGDGDWWQGTWQVDGDVILFLIGGSTRPDAHLVARAQHIATTYAAFCAALSQFLVDEAHRRPMDAAIIAQLVPTRIALFPGREEDAPDAYQGAFVLLHCRDRAASRRSAHEEWRCDICDDGFAHLDVWV